MIFTSLKTKSLLIFGLANLFSFTKYTSAGKGKVPIYMPIPIPIPMPMPPQPDLHQMPMLQRPVSKTSNHHRNEGDSDVRKIYLIQPMPQRPQYQQMPTIKGGISSLSYGGNVQTQAAYGQQSQQPKAYDSHQTQKQTTKSGYDNLKILPIVMMPPMHLQPSSHAYMPMPTSSSVNAYVGGQSPRPTHIGYMHQMIKTARSRPMYSSSSSSPSPPSSYMQDQRSFSDYGGFASRSGYSKMRDSRQTARRYRNEMRQPTDQSFDSFDDYQMPARAPLLASIGRARQKSHMNHRTMKDLVEQRKIFDDDLDDYGASFDSSRDDCCQSSSLGAGSRHSQRRNRLMEAKKIFQDPMTDYDLTQDYRDSQSSTSSALAGGLQEPSDSLSADLDQLLSEQIQIRHRPIEPASARLVASRQEKDDVSRTLSSRGFASLLDGGDVFARQESKAKPAIISPSNSTQTALTQKTLT